ncbi:MAG TPA: hypothetical protein VN648_11550 [Candidatus Methylomirabilis sp.]|nr:hypothetical protein [Candidatus Methylomirabilis sp.]
MTIDTDRRRGLPGNLLLRHALLRRGRHDGNPQHQDCPDGGSGQAHRALPSPVALIQV